MSWEHGKGEKKRGNNYYHDLACVSAHNRAAIVPAGMDASPYEEWKEVNITYPPTGRNETAAAGRELLKILSLV